MPFPFDDLSATKVRPALCLTQSISHYDHVVVAFITSQVLKSTEDSDLVLLKTDTGFSQTGLKVDSAKMFLSHGISKASIVPSFVSLIALPSQII